MQKNEKFIVFFDGNCGFCHRFVRFALYAMKQEPFLFAPRESRLFNTLNPSPSLQPDSIAVYSQKNTQLYYKGEAVRLIFSQLKYPWKGLFYLLNLIPKFMLNYTYDIVAKYRHRFFKKPDDSCPTVPFSQRKFFIH
ncbi:MAG: DUF393 domain-containing protein [Chlamydiia bacterium]|nr:DUF393 domain-containing protein [Chlamydiia bacterium]